METSRPVGGEARVTVSCLDRPHAPVLWMERHEVVTSAHRSRKIHFAIWCALKAADHELKQGPVNRWHGTTIRREFRQEVFQRPTLHSALCQITADNLFLKSCIPTWRLTLADCGCTYTSSILCVYPVWATPIKQGCQHGTQWVQIKRGSAGKIKRNLEHLTGTYHLPNVPQHHGQHWLSCCQHFF